MSTQYNNHSTILADIALAVLNGNKDALDINGTKEIIALYLMIPYMSKKTLISPNEDCFIPKLSGNFCKGVKIINLRNAISHSFVTVEEDDGDPNSNHGKVLILDDRAFYSQKEHDKKGPHGNTCTIPIEYAHNKLIQMAQEVINMHNTNKH